LSKTTEFTFDAVLIVVKAVDGWNWLPEAITLVCSDIHLRELADVGALGTDIRQDWMSVQPEFLWALRVWIVDILLEGDAEW